MIGLLILLIVGVFLAYILNRKIEQTLPALTLTLMLGIYALAVLKKSHHAFIMSICAFAVVLIVFVFMLIHKKTPIFANYNFKNHIGFIVYLIVCITMISCYSTHFVNVWDDFHYNGTFPKDMFYYGTMPYGNSSATFYKSYLPLLQLFFYWGFQGAKGFSEPLMFQYKIVLIYTLLLPLFDKAGQMIVSSTEEKTIVNNRIVGISGMAITVIMPFLFMFEMQESLSMDTVMASIFAYSIVMIVFEEKRDWFCYYRIIVSLICLTLMKSIALMFAGITLGIFLFVAIIRGKTQPRCIDSWTIPKKYSELIAWGISVLGVATAWLSWNIFCNRNGNTNYLSSKLSDNLSEGVTQFPDYASDTFKGILSSVATMNLNLGSRGLSLLEILILAGIVIGVLIYCRKFEKTDFWTSLILLGGLLVYIAFLCYTYVFIFEQWEAESLSSLDRYLGTYATVICYVIVYRYMILTEAEKHSKWTNYLIVGICVVMLISLPYDSLYGSLNPNEYLRRRADYANIRTAVSDEIKPILDSSLPVGYIVIVNNSENDMYSRSLDYEVIPHISRPFNSSLYVDDELQSAFKEKIIGEHPDYIYFSSHEREERDFTYVIPEEYHLVDNIIGLYSRR